MANVHDEARATDTVTVSDRHYLAPEHLWGALHNARLASEKEQELAGTDTAFSPAHRAYVGSAILLSVAFLEALVNEVFSDATDSISHSRVASLGSRCIELMANTWPTSERTLGVVEKFQAALLFADKPRFNTGSNPCQDVESVIIIRNSLVHFKPQWHTHGDPEKLEKRLTGKFALNPFLVGTGNPWFPGKVLSAGCAIWATSACRRFANEWAKRLELPTDFEDSVTFWEAP